MYFPFLDDILKGNKTVTQIKKYVGDREIGYDSIGYFKLLVQTEIEYFTRMTSAAKDTPIAMFGPNGLREKPVSYTHLDVYKRQLLLALVW